MYHVTISSHDKENSYAKIGLRKKKRIIKKAADELERVDQKEREFKSQGDGHVISYMTS